METIYRVSKESGIEEFSIIKETDSHYILDCEIMNAYLAVKKSRVGNIIKGDEYFFDRNEAKKALERVIQDLYNTISRFKKMAE